MRRSFLGITNKRNTKFKIRRSILLAILTLILVAFGGSSVSALDLSQESIEITDKSATTVVHDAGIGDLRITPNLEFNRLDDFISYKLVIKNNDGKKYRIVSITDDNSNEAIALTYSYPTEMDIKNKEIDFTVKYVKITNSPLKTINVVIKIVDEEDASEEIPIVIPNTGANTSFDTVSAVTVQSIIIYIVFAAICCAVYIIVRRKKMEKNKRVDLRVPKALLGFALLLGIIPVAVIAASFENVHFTVYLTEVKLNGPYVITFDTDEGGTSIPDQIVNNGDPITKPSPDPERKGYTFEGWVDENGDPYDFDTPVNGPVKISADWKPITYTIAYDLAGGTAGTPANKTEYTIETPDFTLTNPTKEHYDFAGWTGTDLSGPTTTVKISQGSTENRSYTATWKEKEYTATFDTDGGTPAIANQTKKYNETFTKPADPEKLGYEFKGWFLGDTAYDFATKVTKNITLVAKWEKKEYKVIFDANGGTPTPEVQTVKYQETAIKPEDPTMTGHNFKGWQLNGADYDFATKVTDNITLVAKWEKKEYKVTFDANGGTPTPEVQTVKYQETATRPENPTKDDYRFFRWLDKNGNEYDFATPVTENITLTAEWTQLFVVSFDTGDGGSLVPAQQIANGGLVTRPEDPEKTGYTFKGWQLNGADYDFATEVTGDITLVANWEIINYTISIDLAGGTAGTPANPTSYTIVTSDITLSKPTKEHYDFAGWTSTSDNITTPTKTVEIKQGSTGNRDYTANWTEKEYTVTFDADNGTTTTEQKVKYQQTATEPTDAPTKNGYTFKGWFLGDATDPYDFETKVTKDITLKAKWEAIEYRITYILNGGEDPLDQNPLTYNIETPTFMIFPVFQEGYTFNGWTGSNGDVKQMIVTVPIGTTGDLTYEAHFEINEYTVTFDAKEGTPTPEAQTVQYGNKATRPADPVRKGFELEGWLKAQGTPGQPGYSEVPYNFDDPVKADVNLIAKWAPITYTITYNLDGGEVEGTNPGTYIIWSTFTLINPTKEGYNFVGWTGTDLTEPTMNVYYPGWSTVGDREYTANWEKKEYIVTFDSDGGTDVAKQKVKYQEHATVPDPAPTKTGYRFIKWLDENNTEYNFDAEVTKDITLTAEWQIIKYTISYELNGGEVEGTNPVEYTVKSNSITLINPTKVGSTILGGLDKYEFTGWTGSNGTTPQKTVTIPTGSTGNKNYTANYAHFWKVFFFAGGPGTISETDRFVEENTAVGTLPTVTPDEGYEFKGWVVTDHNVTEQPTSASYVVKGLTNFIAVIEPIEYTVTLDADGGSYSGTSSKTYDIETSITVWDPAADPEPTRDGYVFKGWTGNGITEPSKAKIEIPVGTMGDKTYTANWVELFTVSFNANGGAPTPASQSVADGETATVPTEPMKAGYALKHWADSSDPSESAYDFNAPVTGDITLKAIWWYEKATIVPVDNGSYNTFNLKMKQIANPGATISNAYNFNDTNTKAFKRATDAEYEAIKSSLTADNIVSTTTDSITPVYMWFDDTTGTMYWYTEAAKLEITGSMGRMFAKFNALTDISSFADFDTSKVTDMNRLFQNNESLTNIDALEKWDVSGVTSFRFAFGGAQSYEKGPQIENFSKISKWNVGNVKDFNQMFKHNQALKNLDAFKTWDFSSATDIGNMFTGTTGLQDASAIKDWNVVNVTNFTGVFSTGSGVLPYINTEKLPKFSVKPATWGWKSNGSFVSNP